MYKVWDGIPGKLSEFSEFGENAPLSATREEQVNWIIDQGWMLISVCYIGGCRASGYREYHFMKIPEIPEVVGMLGD